MNKLDIQMRCQDRANELIDSYFGNIVNEAVVDKPEELDEKYTKELPLKIEEEFLSFLADLKQELYPDDTRTIMELIDCPLKRDMILEDYELDVERAYEEAKKVTFWERVTKTNHADVSYFKGLIKQYTEELLEHMTQDFLSLGESI